MTPRKWIESTNAIGIVSKANYHIHSDAIKNVILPKLNISQMKQGLVYASEADCLYISFIFVVNIQFGLNLKVQILFFRHLVLQEHNIVNREIKNISFCLYFPFV